MLAPSEHLSSFAGLSTYGMHWRWLRHHLPGSLAEPPGQGACFEAALLPSLHAHPLTNQKDIPMRLATHHHTLVGLAGLLPGTLSQCPLYLDVPLDVDQVYTVVLSWFLAITGSQLPARSLIASTTTWLDPTVGQPCQTQTLVDSK